MFDFDRVLTGDCLKVLPKLPEDCAELIFADPPFNIGYDYDGEYHDKRDRDEYIDWCQDWIEKCRRILKPNGSMFIAMGDEHAAELKIRITKEIAEPLHLRNWIIWHYRFGQNSRTKFARSHAHIFYLVKDPKNFIFNADPVKVMSGRQKNYADKRAFKTLGKIPDDVWDEFPRVCGTFNEREGLHPCQMPEALLARIIRACSNPDGLVVDPFAGSGTTLAAAKKLGRKYLGIELSSRYVRQIRRRLNVIKVHTEVLGEGMGEWSVPHVDELKALYLESGVALDRIMKNQYLRAKFCEQFHIRIDNKDNKNSYEYSEEAILTKLERLRKSGKLSKTLIQDDARTYNTRALREEPTLFSQSK